MDEIETRARKCISEITGSALHATDEVSIDTGLHLGLGLDSLDHVELMMLAEEEFGIQISDDAADQIKTVGDLIALVRVRTTPRHSGNGCNGEEMTKREQVARALASEAYAQRLAKPIDDAAVLRAVDEYWTLHLGQAELAIKAMLNPTEVMSHAGWRAPSKNFAMKYTDDMTRQPNAVFNAMINAALNERETGT